MEKKGIGFAQLRKISSIRSSKITKKHDERPYHKEMDEVSFNSIKKAT